MNNSKGFTLVELLVAIAVSSLVLAALGYLIITGLKLYGKNNAHVEVQSEAQTTMNLIVDNVMEAQGICAVNPAAGADTDCMLLGDLVIEESAGSYNAFFNGNAVVTDIDGLGDDGEPLREMYLVSFPNDDFPEDGGKAGYCRLVSGVSKSGSDAEGQVAFDAWEKVLDYVRNELNETDRIKWLLARNITSCRMEIDRLTRDYYKETMYYWNGETEEIYYFKEPVTVNIDLALEYDYGNGTITRTLSDSAAIRSRLEKVYIGTGGAIYEYNRKK